MHIRPRETGQFWDCADKQHGVVENIKNHKIGVFLNRNNYVFAPIDLWQGDLPKIGDGVLAYTAYHQKKDRQEILLAQANELVKNQDVKIFSGSLKRHEKGFAFVDDVFIAPHFLKDMDDMSNISVAVVAIYSKNPKKAEFSWRAIQLQVE